MSGVKTIKFSQVLLPFAQKYGIGEKRVRSHVVAFGGHPYNNSLCLRAGFQRCVYAKYQKCLVGKNLRDRIKRGLLFFWKLRTYKGKRNMVRLPSRGQRTHTNAKTKRKFKF